MTDSTQFEMGCESCEAMCLDAVDGTLTAAEQVVFDRHIAGCMDCAEQLSEAKRGAAWMEMLKGHRPEPPAGMLQRILAQTSEAEMSRVFPRHGVVPTPRFDVVPDAGFREKLWFKIESAFGFNMQNAHFQPRLAMTASMAFFSIALTLNLGGVRLTDLKPGAIQRTVGEARASMARTIHGNRVVYQVESRVNELRDDSADGSSSTAPKAAAPKQDAKPGAKDGKQKQAPDDQKPHGTSELVLPSAGLQRVLTSYDGEQPAQATPKNAGQKAAGTDVPRVQRGA